MAFERGDVDAAGLLLTVFVEHLGLDDEALALEDQLDREALDRPEVRLLLAQAAARAYQRSRAVRLVRDSAGDPGAEVFAALARGALAQGDLDAAASDVAEAQRRGPSHPALLGLSDTVKKRRADERAPLEAEAQRLFDEGRFDEAEAHANAITVRWPESAVVQAIVRAGRERRRRAEAHALARAGHDALSAGEGGRALGLLRRAIAMGLHGEDAAQAQAGLPRAEAAEREQEEISKATEVMQLLRNGHRQRGLTAYLDLDDARREMVKKAHGLSELFYLDQTGLRGTGPGAKGAAEAVMALVHAIKSHGAPATTMSLLRLHWAYLDALPDARELYSLIPQDGIAHCAEHGHPSSHRSAGGL